MKLDQTVSLFYDINDFSGQDSVSKRYFCTRLCLFSRLYQCFPDIIFPALQKQNLDLCLSSFFHTIKPCGNYLGIVDHQTVPRL